MAATKSTTKKATAGKTTKAAKTTASKSSGTKAKKTKKTTKTKSATSKTKAKVAKTSKTAKTAAKKTTKKKSSSSKKNQNVVNVFLTDVVKQANKIQKTAQGQTKTWISQLNKQDKQLSQLNSKLLKAKSRSKTSLEKKISKLQTEMAATRSGLLAAESSADKIATFIEWVSQLQAKQSVTAYMQVSTRAPSKPTLVQSKSSKAKSGSSSKQASPFEEDVYPEDKEEDDMNFLFGEDENDEEFGR